MNNLIRRHAPPVSLPKLFAVCVLMVGALAGCNGNMTAIQQSAAQAAPPAAQPAGQPVAQPPSVDPTTGVLPSYNDAYANWKNAGLQSVGGIPTRNTQCGSTVTPTGIIPPNAGDDASVINAAIAACTAGDYVQLGAGTTHAITASISGNTLTVTAGSGLAVGMVLFDTTGVLMPGTTITAGSGSTWTVSYSAYNGTSLTVPSEAMTAVVAFNIDQASEFIHVNKGITLRGSGSYSSGGYWPSVINSYTGPIPNWTISPTQAAANCGIVSTSFKDCSIANPVILISPNGNGGDFGWAGLSTGSGASTSGLGTTLATDVAQGATSIQVASTTNFSVGAWFLIEENPALQTTTNPITGFSNASIQASSDFLSSSPSPATNRVANPDPSGGDTYSWSLYPNLVNQEVHLITAIGAGPCPGRNCTLTFDAPLTIAFRQSGGHNSQVYWPTNCCSTTYSPFLTNAGIENLEITRGFSAVQIEFCAECWVKNIEVGGFIKGAVSFRWSARSELTGSYLHHAFDAENNGTEYPLAVDAGSTEILIDNSIMAFGGKCMVARASGGGNVIAYNYCGPTFYEQQSIGDYWQDESVNGSHYAGTHHILFEGNLGNNCDSDETHGNALYGTFFRNDCTGLRPTFIDPSNTSLTVNDAAVIGYSQLGALATPGPLFSAGPMAFDYWFAYVGNVLGTSGQTTTANGWAYQCNIGGTRNTHGGSKCLWMTGRTGSEWLGAGDPNLNLVAGSGAYIFKSGNYDYVNASIVDWAAGYTQSLPSSLYVSAKPAYFSAGTCTYSWPWVTPTGSTPIQTNSCGGSGLPAKARYEAGTPFKQP